MLATSRLNRTTYVELVQGLGVEVADQELGAVVNVTLVLLQEDGVEVSGVSLALAAGSGSDVAGKGTLGSAVDESLTDEDLSADDDGSGGQELSIDDGHAADEAGGDNDGLHFAVFGAKMEEEFFERL